MKLRFAVAHRTAQHLSDFVVLVAFNVMQHENAPMAGMQAFDGAFQNYAVDRASKNLILGTNVLLWAILFGRLQSLFEGNIWECLPTLMHEESIDSKPMQPSGERGFSAKCYDPAIELEKGFLSKVFRCVNIADHA
jgi:hypothetical protein